MTPQYSVLITMNALRLDPNKQKDISSELGLIQSKVNYHIQLLVNARIIKLEREGNRTKCFIVDEGV